MAKRSSGSIKVPQRLLIYGSEGIGKTTLASCMPNPVFLDTENGSLHIECAERFSNFDNWQDLLNTVSEAAKIDGACTIVVDTIDKAEQMCQAWVCLQNGKHGIEDFGYGKGYVYARDEFTKLLAELDKCIAQGLNVILVAHSQMRKFERPDESGAFDRFELKLNKHISALVKEWADAVLFCDYKTFVTLDANGKGKASGGKRIIRTDHDPCWDAKNRWGLPSELALDSDGIAEVRKNMAVDGVQPSSNPQPQPSTKVQVEPSSSEVEKPKKAKPAKKSGAEKVAAIKDEQKRYSAMTDYFVPLKELMQKDNIGFDALEELLGAKSKTGVHIEDWTEKFTNQVIKKWPTIKERLHDKALAETVSDEEVPF